MQNERILDYNFRFKSEKLLFNENYFIAVYDFLSDEFFELFENIEDVAKFFNVPLYKLIYILRNNSCIEFYHHKYKFYIYEKEKETKIESRKK